MTISLQLGNNDGPTLLLERKQCIKYLGVIIDENITWKNHFSFVCSRISRNIGMIFKFRHYLSLQQLKEIHYNLRYPYMSYGILAWGSAYKTHIRKIQVKQNPIVRLFLFCPTDGQKRERAKALLNLLRILTVNNVYRRHVLNICLFMAKRHTTCFKMPLIYMDTAQDMQLNRIFISLEYKLM